MSKNHVYRCNRCNRRYRPGATGARQWNCTYEAGRMTGVLCPACQTSAEFLDAAINEATTDYFNTPDGRTAGLPKGTLTPGTVLITDGATIVVVPPAAGGDHR